MSVRNLFCDACQRAADMREMNTCPTCRKTICNRCSIEPPFVPGTCINKRQPCVVPGDGIPAPRRLRWLRRLLRIGDGR